MSLPKLKVQDTAITQRFNRIGLASVTVLTIDAIITNNVCADYILDFAAFADPNPDNNFATAFSLVFDEINSSPFASGAAGDAYSQSGESAMTVLNSGGEISDAASSRFTFAAERNSAGDISRGLFFLNNSATPDNDIMSLPGTTIPINIYQLSLRPRSSLDGIKTPSQFLDYAEGDLTLKFEVDATVGLFGANTVTTVQPPALATLTNTGMTTTTVPEPSTVILMGGTLAITAIGAYAKKVLVNNEAFGLLKVFRHTAANNSQTAPVSYNSANQDHDTAVVESVANDTVIEPAVR